MRVCRICLEAKEDARFNRHYNTATSGFKRMCKACQSSQAFVLNRLKKQYPAPVLGTACGICGTQQQQLCLDHDHGSGQYRGFLCAPCNKGIGMLKDDAIILEKAIAYLRVSKHAEPPNKTP